MLFLTPIVRMRSVTKFHHIGCTTKLDAMGVRHRGIDSPFLRLCVCVYVKRGRILRREKKNPGFCSGTQIKEDVLQFKELVQWGILAPKI